MNAQIHEGGAGNWVAFLLGAIFNLVIRISYEGLSEYALQSIIGAVIGGAVWLAFKKISDRMERRRKLARLKGKTKTLKNKHV